MSDDTPPTRPSWMPKTMFKRCSTLINFNSKVKCRGCGAEFDGRKSGVVTSPGLDFYCHCVDCPEYLELQLVVDCTDCGYKFLDKHSLSRHLKSEEHNLRRSGVNYTPTKKPKSVMTGLSPVASVAGDESPQSGSRSLVAGTSHSRADNDYGFEASDELSVTSTTQDVDSPPPRKKARYSYNNPNYVPPKP